VAASARQAKSETKSNDPNSNEKNNSPAEFPFWTFEHPYFESLRVEFPAACRKPNVQVRSYYPAACGGVVYFEFRVSIFEFAAVGLHRAVSSILLPRVTGKDKKIARISSGFSSTSW
jgi:hypothetical protein